MNIYQRLNEVKKAIAYVKKDTQVQTYKAVTRDMVVAATRSHLIEQGVLITVEQTEGVYDSKGEKWDKNANQLVPDNNRLYRAWFNICFVNIDDPADRVTVKLEAHAQDTGDKAPGKAASYAEKNAILKVLSLETGENDESRMEKFAAITAAQVKILAKGLNNDEARIAKFCNWAQVEGLAEIEKGDFDRFLAEIQRVNKGAQHANP